MRALVLRSIVFGYRRGEPVLRGVNAVFRKGHVSIVTGPNGAGKTTLLRIVALLERPWEGSVIVDGIDYWRMDRPESVRRRVVYAPPRPVLLNGDVLDNIAIGASLKGVEHREARRRALALLERLDAESLARKPSYCLSSGEAQLVTVLRAIAALESEGYLVLDEPTSYLDKKRRTLLAQLLVELSRDGIGVIVASHDPILLSLSSTTIYELEDGVLRRGAPLATGGRAASAMRTTHHSRVSPDSEVG